MKNSRYDLKDENSLIASLSQRQQKVDVWLSIFRNLTFDRAHKRSSIDCI